jgi:hypothetical protein
MVGPEIKLLEYGIVDNFREHGNEISGFIKGDKLVKQLSDY